MVGGADEWDQIEAEGQAARAAVAPKPSTSAAPSGASSYGGGDFSLDDDPFADGGAGGALELDLPAQHQRSKAPPGVSVPPTTSMPAGPQPSSAPPAGRAPASMPPAARSAPPGGAETAAPASGPRSIQPRYPSTSADPSALIARFPNPPEKVFETPGYALRVLWRQMELRQDLASLRRRRSPDVPLFERALRTYDSRTFTLGLLLSGAIFAVVTLVVFLPVILRFASN